MLIKAQILEASVGSTLPVKVVAETVSVNVVGFVSGWRSRRESIVPCTFSPRTTCQGGHRHKITTASEWVQTPIPDGH
jgi:hypothetical protein